MGFFLNVYGDTNCFFRKDTFLRLGGFNNTMGFGGEDWELFMRATAMGCALEIIPRALMTYREHDSNYSKVVHQEKSRKRFIESYCHHLRDSSLGETMRILESGDRTFPAHYLPTIGDRPAASQARVVYRPAVTDIVHRSNMNIRAEALGDDLLLKVHQVDSIIELPEFEFANGVGIHLHVDLYASRDSRFAVYTKAPGAVGYTEARCVYHDYRAGHNSFSLVLSDDVSGRVRIDPSEHEGTFIISSLEFRESPTSLA